MYLFSATPPSLPTLPPPPDDKPHENKDCLVHHWDPRASTMPGTQEGHHTHMNGFVESSVHTDDLKCLFQP